MGTVKQIALSRIGYLLTALLFTYGVTFSVVAGDVGDLIHEVERRIPKIKQMEAQFTIVRLIDEEGPRRKLKWIEDRQRSQPLDEREYEAARRNYTYTGIVMKTVVHHTFLLDDKLYRWDSRAFYDGRRGGTQIRWSDGEFSYFYNPEVRRGRISARAKPDDGEDFNPADMPFVDETFRLRLLDVLQSFSNQTDKVSLIEDHVREKPCHLIIWDHKVELDRGYFKLWIEKSNYSILKWERGLSAFRGETLSPPLPSSEFEADNFIEIVKGTFWPRKATWKLYDLSGLQSDLIETRILTYDVVRINEEIDPSKIAFSFPQGTEVYDERKGRHPSPPLCPP